MSDTATDLQAVFERITGILPSTGFEHQTDAVLYIKEVPGTNMTLDQWLLLEDGKIKYNSRLIQHDADHPSHPVHGEFEVELPVAQAEALAKQWLEESTHARKAASYDASLKRSTMYDS